MFAALSKAPFSTEFSANGTRAEFQGSTLGVVKQVLLCGTVQDVKWNSPKLISTIDLPALKNSL